MKISIEKEEVYPSKNEYINSVSNTKRLSILMIEYFIYYFSCIMNKKISIESIKTFINDNVKIAKTEYKISNTPLLSIDILKRNGFIKGTRFMVDHPETLKRLIYCLWLRIKNNYDSVKTYYSLSEIYNFYNDIKYYTTDKTNIVVKDLDDFQKIDHSIYDKIQIGKDKMFLSNEKINQNNPILLQETQDIKEAQVLSANWVRYGRLDLDLKYVPTPNEKIYLYQSKDNVNVINKIKNKTSLPTEVLKYKKNGEIHYLAVAEL